MAGGFLQALYSNCNDAYSAGTEPTRLHPCAVKVMREMDIDISTPLYLIPKRNSLRIYFTYFACCVAEKLTAIARTWDQLRTYHKLMPKAITCALVRRDTIRVRSCTGNTSIVSFKWLKLLLGHLYCGTTWDSSFFLLCHFSFVGIYAHSIGFS